MTEETEKSYAGLTIIRGARHCKIINESEEVVFRTTNLRDAEHYLEIMEENDRLQRLLDARGIAPHRIYLLANDESQRGRVQNTDGVAASEVVIVAKAEGESLVVRYLNDGREEIVDPDEIEPISGGSYLQGPEVMDETVHVVVRYDQEKEQASVVALKSDSDDVQNIVSGWTGEEGPGSEYNASIVHSEGDILLFHIEVSLEG